MAAVTRSMPQRLERHILIPVRKKCHYVRKEEMQSPGSICKHYNTTLRQCSQRGSPSVLELDGGGRHSAVPSGLFQKLPCAPRPKTISPAIPCETCFMPRKPPELVSYYTNLASGGRDCLCHPSFPRCREVRNILTVGIRVLVYDRKKEAGEHTTSTTLPGFSIRSCILQPIFRKIDTTLSHLMPSLMYDVREVRSRAIRGYYIGKVSWLSDMPDNLP